MILCKSVETELRDQTELGEKVMSKLVEGAEMQIGLCDD